MYVRIVTFTLDGPVEAALAYRQARRRDRSGVLGLARPHREGLARRARNAHLRRRLPVHRAGRPRTGRARPTCSRGLAANPAFADLAVREFDTLEAPTSVTAAAVAGPSAVSGGAA